MAAGKLLASSLTGGGSSGRGKLLAASLASGTVRGRILGSSLRNDPAITLTLSNLGGLEPGEPVIVDPFIVGGTATGWLWSCDYPGLVFAAAAQQLRYTPPATLNGVDITWTLQATQTGQPDVVASCVHSVLPHGGGFMISTAGVLYPVLVGS